MTKTIALVAHDAKKKALLQWAKNHAQWLAKHLLIATGSTGKLIENELDIKVNCLASGPLGGDQQLGAMIAEGKVDMLFFFWDPLEAQPHDPDVRALLRMAMVWNIPIACNTASADYFVTSTLIDKDYQPERPDYSTYLNRKFES